MSPEKTEFGDISDVLDSEIAETISEIAREQQQNQDRICPAHSSMSRGITVLLRCQRVALAQEKNRTRVAAGWASGVAAVLITVFEVARKILSL